MKKSIKVRKSDYMVEIAFIFLGICLITAIIFFTAGYLIGRTVECKEAAAYIEKVFKESKK